MSSSPDLARPSFVASLFTTTAERALLVTALCLTVAAGCNSCCAEEPLVPDAVEKVCNLAKSCPDNDEFRYGACSQGGCETDGDCCPGTRCRTDLNACFPRLLDSEFECETNADCPDTAQVCATISVGGRDPLPTCIYETCGGDADCGDFRACYAGLCISNTPCGGACPTGTVCELNSGSCHALPTVAIKDENGDPGVDASCTRECSNGLMILKTPNTMSGDVCCAIECVCEPLPPIVISRIGHYTRVAVSANDVLVSAYDAEFGDLVVARFNPQNGRREKPFEFVDGVPLGGVATNDPIGPRQGIREPGPNVGTHTSIAVDGAGLARIAYHDVSGNALKVAVEGPTVGTWRTHFVDGAANPDVGQVGTFTDIAVGQNGTIFVTYLAHNTTLASVTGPGTGVKLARSRNANPQSAADWELFVVDARPFTIDPALRDEPAEMPRGRGLHTALALDGQNAVIGYYDHGEGDVRVALFSGAGAPTIGVSVVDGDGQGGRRTGDVGRYPAVGVSGTDLLVAYEDSARHELRYWKGPKATPGQGGAYGTADSIREPNRSGSHFVGAGARMSTDGARPVLVHQDASTLDLRFATFDGAAWAPTTILDTGANGFYADVAVSAGKAFVCSVVAELDPRGKERSQLRVDIQPLP